MPRLPSSPFASATRQIFLVAIGILLASSSALASSWDWTTPNWVGSPPGDALTKGAWDTIEELSDFHDGTGGTPANPDTNWHNERNPVHGALLRNPSGTKGLVLMFRHFPWYVFNLDTGTETVFDIGTYPDQGMWPFCSGHAFLPDGKLLITGGDHSYYDEPRGYPVKTPADSVEEFVPQPWASTFDADGNTYAAIDTMPGKPRWYPTNVTMPDGSIWVAAGNYWDKAAETINIGHPDNGEYVHEVPWIKWTGSAWGTVHSDPLGDDVPTLDLYPYFHVLPSGLFYAGNQHDPEHLKIYGTCDECTSWFWAWPDVAPSFTPGAAVTDNRVFNHDHGTSVLLTLEPPYFSWANGGAHLERVLFVGGGTNGAANAGCYDDTTGVRGPHRGAEIYDRTNGTPWGRIASMLYPRKEASGTLLPDGTVFVSGGHYVANPCCGAGTGCAEPNNIVNTPVLPCELFDPADTSWTEMDALNFSYGRKYHSFALLLPDARVLTAGNQQADDSAGAGQNYEIFYPPYLFKSGPALRDPGDRPAIAEAPETIEYGFPFFVGFDHVTEPDSVKACLVAPTAATHANNMTQRRVLLDCRPAVVDGDTVLAVTAPWEPEIAPPGYYLLFLLEAGIPSEAAWVKLQQRADYVVADGETEIWAGAVHLDRDLTVEKGGMLRILPGTEIFAWADRDSTPSGDGKTGVIIRGGIVAEGTEASPIKFTSHLGSGEDDEWNGLSFELTGVERTTYGYVWCLADTAYCNPSPSAADSCAVNLLKYVEIENATAGVTISALRAPSLDSVTFTNIQANRHIYLDGADVVLSPNTCATGNWHTYWNLLPGTHVVASTTVDSNEQLSYGDATKVELVVFGGLTAIGAANDQIYFEAEGETPAPNAWGGLTLRNQHDVLLRYADIGYAATPVFVYAPWAKAAIEYSTIHDFAETGIWMKSCRGGGTSNGNVWVANSIVTRDGLDDDVGDTGIWLEDSDNARVTGTRVLFGSTQVLGVNGVGIDVSFNTSLCSTSASPTRTVLLQDNIVAGPDVNATGVTHTGIRLTGMCGHTYRDIDILENDVENWNYAGFAITQSSDVQVSCNRSEVNQRGMHLTRTTGTSSPVRFRHNTFRALRQDQNLHAVGTNEESGTAIGTATSTVGDNWITAHQTDTKLARNTDTSSLDATENAWHKNTDGGEQTSDTLLSSQTEINDRLSGTVDATAFRTSAPSWSCTTPDTCVTCGSGTTQLVRPAVAMEAPVPAAGAPRITPLVRELGQAVPNPSRGTVELELAVPVRDAGRYTLEVFDAAGRRVSAQDSDIANAGRYTLHWSGRDTAGRRVGAGVYFLRVTGPSFAELRKVVLVQ